MLPRYLIDRLFEEIARHDLKDRWNYATQAGREFVSHTKAGNPLDPDTNFLSTSRFSRYNNIKVDDLYHLLFPAFQECRELVVESAINELDQFLVRLKAQIQTAHANAIYAGGKPKEDFGRQIASAAVFGFFQREGFVYHEVLSGVGLIDILVCSDHEIVIEAKLHSNFDPNSRQLHEYVTAGAKRHGYYLIFDTTRSYTNKIYCDIENDRFPPADRYAVIVCHVNPPRPSDV